METKAELNDRWRSENREEEVAEFRERRRKKLKQSDADMTRAEINDRVWDEAAREFPPLPPEEPSDVDPEFADCGRVNGLADIPDDWPEMPSNASLSAEISWVQSNRLLVVREKQDGTSVDLSKARTPAPSYAAIGWLETSIRAFTKYCDIAAKVTSQQADEQEHVRRERMQIAEIRELLDEMHRDPD